MNKQASARIEQTLINIVRSLPPNRVAELLDFARFLHALVKWDSDEIKQSESEDRASDDKWDALFAKPEAQRAMVNMARAAREDFRAGRTTEIKVTKDGRLAPK